MPFAATVETGLFVDKACYRKPMQPVDIQQCADRASAAFDAADFVHAEARRGLLDRLEGIVVPAATVVDLGSATGSALPLLRRRFPRARLLAVDLSYAMLLRARRKRGLFERNACVQADAQRLPLADHCVDVVFANLLLPWVPEPAAVFREVARVLSRDGVFAFSTLGPDSLPELRAAWATVAGGHAATGGFADMHDVGDAALQAGLRDPVLDVERRSVSFASRDVLLRDLAALGAPEMLIDEVRSSAGSAQLEFALELIYGHCFGAGVSAGGSDARIDPRDIGRRRR